MLTIDIDNHSIGIRKDENGSCVGSCGLDFVLNEGNILQLFKNEDEDRKYSIKGNKLKITTKQIPQLLNRNEIISSGMGTPPVPSYLKRV